MNEIGVFVGSSSRSFYTLPLHFFMTIHEVIGNEVETVSNILRLKFDKM